MKKKWNYLKYGLLIVIIFLLLDYLGIFIKIVELDYEEYFANSLHKNSIKNHEKSPIDVRDFSYLQNVYKKCNSDETIRLTIIVKSALNNFQRRDAIRRTWGKSRNLYDTAVETVFNLGISNDNMELMHHVDLESARYNDIIQFNFIDTYFNNTIKTSLGMRWAMENCSSSQFFMFVDDDYYVSIRNVLDFILKTAIHDEKTNVDELQAIASLKRINTRSLMLFAGNVFQTAPLRFKFSKWYVPLEEYPFNLWPPYVTAGAFLLSNKALRALYNEILISPLFRFDDIFLAMMAIKANVNLTHCDMFYFHRPVYRNPKSFQYVIASHEFNDPEEMEEIWKECHDAGYA